MHQEADKQSGGIKIKQVKQLLSKHTALSTNGFLAVVCKVQNVELFQCFVKLGWDCHILIMIDFQEVVINLLMLPSENPHLSLAFSGQYSTVQYSPIQSSRLQ